ncbi:MAG: hypothetical protein ACT4OK_21600 [Gemmobacter sp.]
MTVLFGAIVLLALAGVDYGAAANTRPEGRPLGIGEHVMTRVALAREAIGLSPPPPAAPATSFGQALAAIQGALGQGNAGQTPPAGEATRALEAAIASGDTQAMGAAVEAEFARVAAELEGASSGAAPKPGRAPRPGTITVGIGTCTKGGAGKFCSVGD